MDILCDVFLNDVKLPVDLPILHYASQHHLCGHTCTVDRSSDTCLLSTCIAIDCGLPGNLTNGKVNFTTTGLGSIASFSCDKGYQLEPFAGYFRFCLLSGAWSGQPPTCVGK